MIITHYCLELVMCLILLHHTRILVGAPKDNITDSDALDVVKQFVRPGVVYQCPLTPSSQDCTDVKIDREGKCSVCVFVAVRNATIKITLVLIIGIFLPCKGYSLDGFLLN